MLCFLYKWNISRALDTGKPLSRLTKRHLDGCESCRGFSRLSREMERRLTEEAASFLGDPTPEIGEKVRQSIAGLGPVPSAHRTRPRFLSLRPALAAALLLVAVGVSIIWIARPQPAGMPRIDPLLDLKTGRADLLSAMEKAESPYQKEIQGLKRTLQSTAGYLAARFDINLGPDRD
jgi:hypothetical protein